MSIRQESTLAQTSGGPKIIRVRGVAVSGGTENRRLKWTGEAYEETQDVIEFFPDSGDEPRELAEDEEAMCVWMPAAARWEEFSGGGGSMVIGQTTATVADTDATFTIDNIFCVEGADPRTDPESASETLLVKNSLGLGLENNHNVVAKQNKAGAWETWADTSGEGVPAEFYMTIKGVLGGSEGDAITASTSTFTITGLTLVNGTEVPGSLTVTNNPPLHAPPGATIYARYNLLVGSGDTDHWDTASSKNFLYMVKGIGGYDSSVFQIPLQNANDNPDWKTFTGKDESTDRLQALGQEAGTYKFVGIATIAKATADTAVAATDATFSATITDIIQGRNASGTVTVNNDFGFTIDDDGLCEIKLPWDGDDADDWYCSQAECPA